MKILSKSVLAKHNEILKVYVDRPAVVKFLTPEDYKRYKRGKTHRYWGGYAEESPAQFQVPEKGSYYAVVEKGTFSNPIDLTARVEVCPPEFDYLNGMPENETHTAVEGEYDDTLE